MRALDPDLVADLDAGATTLCRCWRLVRADGLVQGFTDHDADLSFGGTDYRAATGFTASAIEASLGLNVDGVDVAGALADGSLTELELGWLPGYEGSCPGEMVLTYAVFGRYGRYVPERRV